MCKDVVDTECKAVPKQVRILTVCLRDLLFADDHDEKHECYGNGDDDVTVHVISNEMIIIMMTGVSPSNNPGGKDCLQQGSSSGLSTGGGKR